MHPILGGFFWGKPDSAGKPLACFLAARPPADPWTSGHDVRQESHLRDTPQEVVRDCHNPVTSVLISRAREPGRGAHFLYLLNSKQLVVLKHQPRNFYSEDFRCSDTGFRLVVVGLEFDKISEYP